VLTIGWLGVKKDNQKECCGNVTAWGGVGNVPRAPASREKRKACEKLTCTLSPSAEPMGKRGGKAFCKGSDKLKRGCDESAVKQKMVRMGCGRGT